MPCAPPPPGPFSFAASKAQLHDGFVRTHPVDRFRIHLRADQRALELLLFGFSAVIFLREPFPFTGFAMAGSATAVLLWLAAGCGYACMMRLANSPRKHLQVVFTRYLLTIALTAFLAIRFVRCFTFGVRHSQLVWPSSLAAVAVLLAAAAALPRLRSFKESTALARLEHASFLAAAESTLDDFYIFDGVYDESGDIVDFRFRYINPNAERRLHVRREVLIGQILTEVRPFMVTSGLIHHYREVVRTGVPYITEVFLDDERIQATWLNVQVVKLGNGIAVTSRDVTEARRSSERIFYLAHYDQLTGLPNRTLFQDRLKQAVLRAERHGDKVALFLLDIDNFKRINDTLGHSTGDALLAAIANRLTSSVREGDTVARLGGDEFIVVMPEFQSLDDIRHRGAAIVRNVSQPIVIGEHYVSMTVSVGACIYPDDAPSMQDLLKNADRAMYSIKDSGRNGFKIFHHGSVEEVALPETDQSETA